MYLTDLALNDFRSYTQAVLKLSPGVTTFIGENGQGKTNLVEAIAYLATFSSHRVAADAALVRQGASAGVVRARVQSGDRSTLVELEIISGKANRARINRGAVKPSELLGLVRTVVFAPEDLELVRGDPGSRRRYLDDLMVQFRPRLGGVKADYEKVLKQRAALLKAAGKARRRGGSIDLTTLDIFDTQLARLGAVITAARAEMIGLLRPHVERHYTDVSGGKGIARVDYLANVDHRTDWELPSIRAIRDESLGPKLEKQIEEHEVELRDSEQVEARLLQALGEWRNVEIERGVNLVGPHRDDLVLSLGTLPAKGYASHGESWSYALALRLAAWEVLREHESGEWSGDGEPILILDDVFAELDSRRRQRLTEIVVDAQQVFITAAVGADVPEELGGARFGVHEGVVEQIGGPVAEAAEEAGDDD